MMFLVAVKVYYPEKGYQELKSFLKSKRSKQVNRSGLVSNI